MMFWDVDVISTYMKHSEHDCSWIKHRCNSDSLLGYVKFAYDITTHRKLNAIILKLTIGWMLSNQSRLLTNFIMMSIGLHYLVCKALFWNNVCKTLNEPTSLSQSFKFFHCLCHTKQILNEIEFPFVSPLGDIA